MEFPRTKVSSAASRFAAQNLSETDIAVCMIENAPQGVLAQKWTMVTVQCPACFYEAFDKYKGGVNIDSGNVEHTEYIYHCRVCDLNLTEEEYREVVTV
jgi:hypothetical protein